MQNLAGVINGSYDEEMPAHEKIRAMLGATHWNEKKQVTHSSDAFHHDDQAS